LGSIKKIAFVKFQTTDVVRHGLVSEIIAAYERACTSSQDFARGNRR